VDLDGDGRTDILSGSWPGEIYLFRRNADGSFAGEETLRGSDGKPLNVGSASAAFAADWDGDGKLDLIVGASDGSVVWYRNAGGKLEAARTLVKPSPLGWGGDDRRNPGEWGLRVKPCVVDWDGDGRLDLLLGDRCGGFQAKPTQTEEEKAEERQANDKLPQLRRQWAEAFQEYRKLGDAPEPDAAAGRQEKARRLDELREKMVRLKDEMVRVQDIQSRYRPGYQAHGFVWLFLRKPVEGKKP